MKDTLTIKRVKEIVVEIIGGKTHCRQCAMKAQQAQGVTK